MSEVDPNRRCGNCGLAVDHMGDAMVYCKKIKMRVCKCSLACLFWCDEKVF